MTIRRVTRNRPPTAPKKTKTEMLALLQSIAKMQETVDKLRANMKPLMAELEEAMLSASISSLDSGTAVAEMTRSSGKAQTTIDPRKFHDIVDEKDFYECITVGVTKARTVLSEKEISRIASTVPGKPGPLTLSVTLA